MKIFLSWSGQRSKKIASALNNWIPKVIQIAQPWMSDEDISTGSRWNNDLNEQLEKTTIGIICVTPENQQSIWLHFEAGSLSKSLSESKVMPLIYELTPGQISGPMAQFQAVTCTKEGVRKIINSVNDSLGDGSINEIDLSEIFEVWWPKLQDQLDKIENHEEHIPKRESSEMIEELLDIAREQRRVSEERSTALEDKKEDIKKIFEHMQTMLGDIDKRSKDSANLEKHKLAFLANNQNDQQSTLHENVYDILPKELTALIDKHEGEGQMKELMSVFTNIQTSMLKDTEDSSDDKA